MKQFFTIALFGIFMSHSIQDICPDDRVHIISAERLNYVIDLHRAAKDIFKYIRLNMHELRDIIKRREESGHMTEKDTISHMILYYTMLEIENENKGESYDSPHVD
jgi:hypothetical protein